LQIEGVQPFTGGEPPVVRFRGPGQLGGVDPQQVVERVAPGGVLGEQVQAGQLAQRRQGRREGAPGQRRGGVDGQVRPRVQAEQPEQAGRLGAQRAVRPGEDPADVAVGQRVQGGTARP
jgi:hypothetical protein